MNVLAGLSCCRDLFLPSSEHERQGREPENLADQGHNRRERGDGAKNRERKDDSQSEILERSEDREGHLVVPREAERSAERDDEDPDAERPNRGEKPEREEEFRSAEQGAARGACNRDDEKKEGDADAARPDVSDLSPSPQRP